MAGWGSGRRHDPPAGGCRGTEEGLGERGASVRRYFTETQTVLDVLGASLKSPLYFAYTEYEPALVKV